MKPESIYKDIGAIVKTVRRRADMSQKVLAAILHISRATLASIETGRQRIRVHQLYGVAHALGVRVRDLLPALHGTLHGANWPALNFDTDLSTEQKKQIAILIGPMESESQQAEGKNEQTSTTRRNAREPRAKATR
jgi:transcriptional regulator with XRE-family HTH domain